MHVLLQRLYCARICSIKMPRAEVAPMVIPCATIGVKTKRVVFNCIKFRRSRWSNRRGGNNSLAYAGRLFSRASCIANSIDSDQIAGLPCRLQRQSVQHLELHASGLKSQTEAAATKAMADCTDCGPLLDGPVFGDCLPDLARGTRAVQTLQKFKEVPPFLIGPQDESNHRQCHQPDVI